MDNFTFDGFDVALTQIAGPKVSKPSVTRSAFESMVDFPIRQTGIDTPGVSGMANRNLYSALIFQVEDNAQGKCYALRDDADETLRTIGVPESEWKMVKRLALEGMSSLCNTGVRSFTHRKHGVGFS